MQIPAARKSPLQVAVVGLGNIGNVHAGCYAADPRTEVVAVCDVIPERADDAAAKYGARPFYSVSDLLASGVRIDAASVCTAGVENGGDHYGPTIELLRAGIPTLGEKPISNDLAQAEEMVALARDRGVPYGINLNHRFTPAARRAREWLDQGRLGELNLLNMTMWINNPNESAEHFHMRALHPHSIDVMRYFGGDIAKVHAFFKKGAGRQIWSNVQVNMLFESGLIGHLTGSYDAGAGYGLETCELVGSQGRVVIEDACVDLTLYPCGGGEIETHHELGGMKGFGETFGSRISAWVDDLLQGTPPEDIDARAEDALRAQRVIEAAIASWREDRVVAVAEISAAPVSA